MEVKQLVVLGKRNESTSRLRKPRYRRSGQKMERCAVLHVIRYEETDHDEL